MYLSVYKKKSKQLVITLICYFNFPNHLKDINLYVMLNFSYTIQEILKNLGSFKFREKALFCNIFCYDNTNHVLFVNFVIKI